MLVDIGANLTHESFARDLEAVLERGAEAGVTQLVVTGTDERHSAQALELAQQYPGRLYATVGVHPHDATTLNDAVLARLECLAAEQAAVAVGECGLDFNRDYSPRKQQEFAFEAQLELAVSLQLPVFLHQRDAFTRFQAVLSRYRDKLADGVAHCFTGTREELHGCLDLDLAIGITGWICDERRGHHLRELVAEVPAPRLMLETDAPYLLPRDLKPKPKSRRNEPMYLPHICEQVARWRDESNDELARLTGDNARRFFGLEG